VLQQRLNEYGDNPAGEVAKELRDAQARASGKKPKRGKHGGD
jgi:hypothetical protein